MKNEPENLDYLKQKINQLEDKVEKLLSSQAASNSHNAVQVTGALETNKIKTLQVSPQQLVNIYNDVPQVLLEYIKRVSLTEESYRNKDKGLIILEEAPRGNYWVITTRETNRERHWIVPNGNVYFNIFQTQSLRYLFQVEGENFNDLSEFILREPARVALEPNGREWKLEKKGILHLGKTALSSKLPLDSEFDEQQEKSRVVENELFTFIKKIEKETIKKSKQALHSVSKYDSHLKEQLTKINNTNNELETTKIKTNIKIENLQSRQKKIDKKIKIFVGLGTVIAIAAATILYLGNRQINQLNTTLDRLDANLNQLNTNSNKLQDKIIALEDKTGRNIVNLLQEKKITVKAKGTGLTKIELEICPNINIEHQLTVLIPAGSFYESTSENFESASLITTRNESVIFTRDRCSSLIIPSLTTSFNKKLPQSKDTLTVKRKDWQPNVKKLLNLIAKDYTQLNDFESIMIQQTAILILAENADYESLEKFNAFVSFSQNIDYVETINPNQTLNGQLAQTDAKNPTQIKKFKDDYLLSWIPPNYKIKVDLLSSEFDTYLEIIDASTGEVLNKNDDGGEGSNSQLQFTTKFGRNYLIRVTSFLNKDTGAYSLRTKTNNSVNAKLINEDTIVKAIKLIDEAEINITDYDIWLSRNKIEDNVKNRELKKWLQQKYSNPI